MDQGSEYLRILYISLFPSYFFLIHRRETEAEKWWELACGVPAYQETVNSSFFH